jgi:hypothetical protein
MINISCKACLGTGTVMIATVIKMDCPVCAQEIADIKADAVIEAAIKLFAYGADADYKLKLEKYAEELRNKNTRSQ